jgi:hypothetical protein
MKKQAMTVKQIIQPYLNNTYIYHFVVSVRNSDVFCMEFPSILIKKN